MLVSDEVISSLDIRSRTIVHCCTSWFSQDAKRCSNLLQIIQRKMGYSLRVIDWMVTNYCKRFPVTIVYNGNPTDVHNDYERHLAVFNKRFYDPFARREKIKIKVLGTELLTTVGQLNFFKWFIDRSLYDTVRLHLRSIETDMRNGGSRKKNKQPPDTNSVVVHRGEFCVGF